MSIPASLVSVIYSVLIEKRVFCMVTVKLQSREMGRLIRKDDVNSWGIKF